MEAALKKFLVGGKFHNVSVARSRSMAAVKGRNNRSTELTLRMALVRAGVGGWRTHTAVLPGKPDVFFPAANVAVFLDGCFWHGCLRCGHVPKTNSLFWREKIGRN